VFEGALGLPQETGAIDIDRQLEIFRQRSEAVFGVSNPADFTDPSRLDDLRTRFLVSAPDTGPSTTSPALTLLSGNGSTGRILAALYGA